MKKKKKTGFLTENKEVDTQIESNGRACPCCGSQSFKRIHQNLYKCLSIRCLDTFFLGKNPSLNERIVKEKRAQKPQTCLKCKEKSLIFYKKVEFMTYYKCFNPYCFHVQEFFYLH